MSSRGISLRGAAAGAFVEMLTGRSPKTEDDKQIRIATAIHFAMKKNTKIGEDQARAIVSVLAREGIDKTLEHITGIKAEPVAPSRAAPAPVTHLLPGEKVNFSRPKRRGTPKKS